MWSQYWIVAVNMHRERILKDIRNKNSVCCPFLAQLHEGEHCFILGREDKMSELFAVTCLKIYLKIHKYNWKYTPVLENILLSGKKKGIKTLCYFQSSGLLLYGQCRESEAELTRSAYLFNVLLGGFFHSWKPDLWSCNSVNTLKHHSFLQSYFCNIFFFLSH